MLFYESMNVSQPSQTLQSPESIKADAAAGSGYPREFVLFICFLLVLMLLAFTAFLARMYHKDIHVVADGWFSRGESEFKLGNPSEAIVDYRNALAYSPGNPIFQLHLAEALTVAGRRDEARSYLLNLLTENPGSGQINLDLARNSLDSMPDSMRYYNGAIYGYWESDPMMMRWKVRRELCEYLLNRRAADQVEPEIIALAQEVPSNDVESQKVAAALLLRVNLWSRALEEYRAILAAHKSDQDALAGAGIASFHLGQYARATLYFDQLPRERREASDIARLLSTTQAIEAENPFFPRLSDADRARRITKALALAQGRLEDCMAQLTPVLSGAAQLQPLLNQLRSRSPNWNERAFAHNQSQVDAAIALVFQAENAATAQCGEPQDSPNRALSLIGQSESAGEQ